MVLDKLALKALSNKNSAHSFSQLTKPLGAFALILLLTIGFIFTYNMYNCEVYPKLSLSENTTETFLENINAYDIPYSTAPLNTAAGDLNSLLTTQIKQYDALSSRWLSTNGTLSDYNYFTLSGIPVQSGASNLLIGLDAVYQQNKDPYCLAKIRAIVDQYIDDPAYEVNTEYGLAIFIPAIYYDGRNHDSAVMLTAQAALVSLRLYEYTGDEKYKTFADDFAYQSRCWFPVVDNATDLAWSSAYWQNRDVAQAKSGVNRMGSIAWFYSEYASYNSSYADSVPLILNWIWRAQTADGSLAYSIDDPADNTPYSAFAVYFALNTYENLPSAFTTELKAKINATLTTLSSWSSTQTYLINQIFAAMFVKSIESNFISNPSEVYLELTNSYFTMACNTLQFSDNGVSSSIWDDEYGFTWSGYFVSAMFDCYPLPPNLSSSSDGYANFVPSATTGRYYWNGPGLNLQNIIKIYCPDSSYLTAFGTPNMNLFTSPTSSGSGVINRHISNMNGAANISSSWSGVSINATFYSDTSFHANITGTSTAYILDYTFENATIMCSNGGTHLITSLDNGTYYFTNDFMIIHNVSALDSQSAVFIRLSSATPWTFTNYNSLYWTLTNTATNYAMTMAYMSGWGNNFDQAQWHHTFTSEFQYRFLETKVNRICVDVPLTFSQQISNYRQDLEAINSNASWLNLYKTAISSAQALIAICNPEINCLQTWTGTDLRRELSTNQTATILLCWDLPHPPKQIDGITTYNFDEENKLLTLISAGNTIRLYG